MDGVSYYYTVIRDILLSTECGEDFNGFSSWIISNANADYEFSKPDSWIWTRHLCKQRVPDVCRLGLLVVVVVERALASIEFLFWNNAVRFWVSSSHFKTPGNWSTLEQQQQLFVLIIGDWTHFFSPVWSIVKDSLVSGCFKAPRFQGDYNQILYYLCIFKEDDMTRFMYARFILY